jgi:hypothetical protein
VKFIIRPNLLVSISKPAKIAEFYKTMIPPEAPTEGA